MFLAFCSNDGMTYEEQIKAALSDLCSRHGGVEAVADAAKLSAESLKQVLAGTKLPSGRPRGLGPSSREKLEKVFPGWMSSAQQDDAEDELENVSKDPNTGQLLIDGHRVTAEEVRLVQALRELLPEHRGDATRALFDKAEEMRRIKAHFQAATGAPAAIPDHRLTRIKAAPSEPGKATKSQVKGKG